MALYTLTPEVWGRGTPNYLIRIRPAGWMPRLGGALRSYGADRETFARDLARFLFFTEQDLKDVLRPGAVARDHEGIELTDEDAGYLQWPVESTKRVYIELEIRPLPQKHTRDVFTVTVLTAEGQPLSRALPLKASVLLQLLALINPEQTVQFVWQRAIEQMEPFSAVTVPHLWAFALSSEDIDLATWLQHPMPAMQPILVFADAIRIDVFSEVLQEAYREWHTYACPLCGASYALVAQITDQARFDGLPQFGLQPFCTLRRSIESQHPDHTAERLRSNGVSVWPAPASAKPANLHQLRSGILPPGQLTAGLLP